MAAAEKANPVSTARRRSESEDSDQSGEIMRLLRSLWYYRINHNGEDHPRSLRGSGGNHPWEALLKDVYPEARDTRHKCDSYRDAKNLADTAPRFIHTSRTGEGFL